MGIPRKRTVEWNVAISIAGATSAVGFALIGRVQRVTHQGEKP
jgi:hypothetical protein